MIAARGIVDGAHERERGPPAAEPVVARPVDLEQDARLGHPLASAPVPWRPARAHWRHARLGEDAPQGALGDLDPLPLREQVREVRPVTSA